MKRTYGSHLERQVATTAQVSGDDLRLAIGEGGEERVAHATLRQAANGDWLIDEGGVTRRVVLTLDRGTAWVTVVGTRASLAQTSRWRRIETSRKGSASAETAVRSPMTGRVVVLPVQVGDVVHKGQALVVVEAMKMEHTLKAPCDGTVARISCQVGQLVEGGQDLVDLDR